MVLLIVDTFFVRNLRWKSGSSLFFFFKELKGKKKCLELVALVIGEACFFDYFLGLLVAYYCINTCTLSFFLSRLNMY